MSEYSQTYGSFERTGNYPLEADLLFNSKQELDEWAEQHKEILHEGLLKIAIEDGKQKLYWAVTKDDDIIFEEFSSGGGGELEEDVEVLGLSQAVGNISNGVTLQAGTSFTDFVKRMLVKPAAPTYSVESFGNLSNNSYEIGTTLPNTIIFKLNKKQGGPIDITETKKFSNWGISQSGFIDLAAIINNDTDVKITDTTVTITLKSTTNGSKRIKEGTNSISSKIKYKENASYGISSGSLTATKSISGFRYNFYSAGIAPNNSDGIRTGTKSSGNSFSFALPANTTNMWVALQPGKRITKVTDAGALNADITGNFKTAGTVSVSGATKDKDEVDYTIYQMTGYGPFGNSHSLSFTIA